ncbi:PREDICTED: trypsin-1-like [Dinoponera quadriceps]|uniref:Trypsin-1-like n=1 Tax=Dinoponera quadriceps TaxID=609295 RepID=A0A6P3XYS1_DINQU|nr:PREDICTED: trypsin-1-like [Dinoponera quadriceps]
MSPKVIVVFAFLAVALAGKPYLGFRLPYDWTQVVGGEDAPRSAYPFIVSLQWGIANVFSHHFCAGSILNENWIVTAAHCINAVPSVGLFQISAGRHKLRQRESSKQNVHVAKTWVHENYGGSVGPYDIGLLKLSGPLKMTKEVQAIKLPEEGSVPEKGDAILCGWGSTSRTETPSKPDSLQHANVTYIDLITCDATVERLTGTSHIHHTNVCTGSVTNDIAACIGDSGGPLFEKKNSNFVLTGIVSWGFVPCGIEPDAPSVFTNPSMHIHWIENIINNN